MQVLNKMEYIEGKDDSQEIICVQSQPRNMQLQRGKRERGVAEVNGATTTSTTITSKAGCHMIRSGLKELLE